MTKLAAITCAGATDVNDELTIVLMAAEAALKQTEPGTPLRLLLYEIEAAGNRAAIAAGWTLIGAEKAGARPALASVEKVCEL